MSTPSGPRLKSTGRGRGLPRASLRSRASRIGARGAPSMGFEGGTRRDRQSSPGAIARGARQTSPGATRGTSESQPHLKPQPTRSHTQKKTRRDPVALNAAFQSHAGKIANPRDAGWRNSPFKDLHLYNKQMNDLYQTLKQSRERERKQAIKDGFLADPDKPTTLANAITPVGTCQDMCPEFERVERIVQLMVDGREKIQTSTEVKEKFPFEEIMVKRFRRSAAGYDEQLPSDIRPPAILQKTLDYLFNDVVGGPEPLATVHKFVWDRTRSVRNDFSIQQVTKVEDLTIAIDCFERIARFHILSLHQLSGVDAGGGADSGEFDPYQEREQLNNTLLSLQYYYDDSRHKLNSPSEAEFRAYGIIFEIQDQRPDVEDRLQSLPKDVLKDRRVRTALELHAAAGNTSDEQGPLRPRTRFLTAQANSGHFWSLVKSNAVSYLMACVAEVYFNLVRRIALEAIWKAYKGKRPGPTKMEDWTLSGLTQALGFDNEAQTRTFCEQHEFTISERLDHEHHIDLGSVTGGSLTDQNPRRKQVFSRNLVEPKRLGRTLPAVINGMTASQAQSQGFTEDATDAETVSTANSESLFVDGDSDDGRMQSRSRSSSPFKKANSSYDTSELNILVTPGNQMQPSISGSLFMSKSLHAAIDGKPDATSKNEIAQSEHTTPPLASSSEPVLQPNYAPSDSNSPPKFDLFAPRNMDHVEKPTDQHSNFGHTGLPNIDFRPSAETIQSTGTNNSNQDLVLNTLSGRNPIVLDQPLVFTPNVPAVSGDPSNHTPLAAATAPPPQRSIFDQTTASSTPPTFSFGTSALFGPSAANPRSENVTKMFHSTTEAQASNTLSSVPSSFNTRSKPTTGLEIPTSTNTIGPRPTLQSSNLDQTKPIMFKTPTVEHSPTPETRPKSSSITPSVVGLSQPDDVTFASQSQQVSQFSHSNATDRFQPKGATVLSQTSALAPKSSTSPDRPPQSPRSAHPCTSTAAPNLTSTTERPSQSMKDSPPLIDSKLASRSTILDRLSGAIMVEDKGLLQQFIEYSVGPIIMSSMAQIEDEVSWKVARECRVVLLSIKYFRKWRAYAWSLSLMRKGRDRRKNFARSIQELARSTRSHGPSTPLQSPFIGPRAPRPQLSEPTTTITPKKSSTQNWRSLPNAHCQGEAAEAISSAVLGAKRKRGDPTTDSDQRAPRSTKILHRRSQTVGNSIMSAPPHGLPYSPHRSRTDVSKVAAGSMLNDILIKQARRLAPTARSDTTRTDYFRLKALGIDPDTPIVPLAKKRSRMQFETSNDNDFTPPHSPTPSPGPRAGTSQLASQISPLNPNMPHNPPTAADDDDALFAQIRSVRDALAESEQWFQSERQSIERGMTPQRAGTSASGSGLGHESPAQRRLREIKERGPTPSRTELRLRAMGDRALLPQGFWDGEGMGLSLKGVKGNDVNSEAVASANQLRPNGPIGFAAMTQMKGTSGVDVHIQEDREGAAMTNGSSVEDAIEL